jgi:hypothetical protein
MKLRWLAILAAITVIGVWALSISAATDPGVTLIATGSVLGSALDLSGLQGHICALDFNKNVTNTCIAHATLGGFGSGLTYTGHDNVFIAVTDRGPFDGRTNVPYLDRFHFMHITVDPATHTIHTVLLDTRLLIQNGHDNFVGDAYAFSTTNPLETLRLDPEAVRVSGDGDFFISDEYGPYVLRFNRHGHLQQRIDVPSKFLLADPPAGNQSGDLDNPTDANSLELYPDHNVVGRQANRGMEGLAITPDDRTLVGIMQNALLQDNALTFNAAGIPSRAGLNNRIVKIGLETGETHEYVYSLDAINRGKGVNEMLAINDHEFLVLERDNRTFLAGTEPELKRIYKVDLNKANLTDVSGIVPLPKLPSDLANAGITPVDKSLFIDLLNPDYKVDASHTIKQVIAEKIEGMAWGPDLPDGRHLLLVTSDNDLNTQIPTQIYAFAIDGSAAHIDYQSQQYGGPMFPPGQVKKALKRTF